jgi:hypothetical protein
MLDQITGLITTMSAKQGIVAVLLISTAGTGVLNEKINQNRDSVNDKLDLIITNQVESQGYLTRELDYMHRTIDKLDSRLYERHQDTLVFNSDGAYRK